MQQKISLFGGSSKLDDCLKLFHVIENEELALVFSPLKIYHISAKLNDK